ncbi:YceI family protein [Castellaniella ginsengisoli]|uniref:YceI family protein n=1 Tax=Castellaniella ginsengisoli TaxID=546114 RepID=A0AB39CLD9_9BURK
MNTVFFRPFALAAVLSLGMPAVAGAVEYTTLDAQASHAAFAYSQMNVKMDGRFGALAAPVLSFDPARPEAARVVIEVALAGVDAGYDEANAELSKDEWLATAAHPLAVFTSDQVDALGDGRYQATGRLTIKGVTKTVAAPFTFKEDGQAGVFEGGFTFQRADFGVGEGPWKDFSIVANDIGITFRVVAKP